MDTSNQPWLNDLPDDDWFPSPTTPTTPPPARPVNDSRPSGVQNSPSRIPVPARRPPERSPDEGKKRITRPCHFIKREPPTPKRQSPKTPRKWRSPVPDKSKKSPKPSPAAARKQQPPAQAGSPLRSVSNASSQPGQQDTVQVRPKNDREGETTPEWRRRLVQGGIPSGEQRDLFAPVGLDKLESVFKPPSPDSETARHGKIPMAKQSDDIQSGGEDLVEAHDRNQNTRTAERDDGDDPFENLSNPNTIPEATNKGTATSLDLPKTTREMRKAAYQNHSNEGLSQNEMRPRTASGLEDLRNEGITPITFSRPGTVNGKATSEIIQSAIKQVTNKLGNLSLDHDERPDSRMSDSVLLYQQSDPHANLPPQDELLDISSHSLPQDFSMGTQESGNHRDTSNFRRGEYLSESSFRRDFTPSSFPSRHLSPAALTNSRIRSSPPSFQRPRSVDPPSLPRWSSNARTSVAEDPEASQADAMPSSGSPLKLFGDHDTFTNNKLLRRMSQFEEILGDSPEDEPVSPSEEARRKGASRGFLNVAHNTQSEQSLRSERPRSRNGMNHRISRFGDGQLDNFGFSDTSPYEPKLVYDEFSNDSIPLPSRPRTSDGRQDRRRSSFRNYTLGSTSTRSSTGRSAWSGSHRPATSDAVASHRGPTAREGLRYRETERSFNSPKAYPTPKRRRTVLRAASTNKENLAFGDSPAQFSDDMSLLQKSLVQQGMDRDDGIQSLRPQSAQQPRAPTPSQHKSSEVEGGSPNRNRSKSGSNDRRAPEFLSERKPVPKVKVTGANEERRKGSITTQDFLSEATKIMDVIRSKGKNAGGLPSLEELAMEGENSADGYEDESTLDEFVRPPSREGIDVRKLREPKVPDPRVLSHLRKFQENEDLEFGASASFCLDKVHNTEGKDDIGNSERERDVMGTILQDLGIPENAMDARKRKYSVPFASEDDSKNLSARSIPTGSSQSSHAKGVLSSDLVSHLIPEQVNGLTYDRFKNLWVKERARRSRGTPKTDDSEDDPFNGIPDLSVDELQEMMGIQPFDSPQKGNSTEAEGDFSNRSNASPRASTARPEPRPQARDGEQSVNGSSVQSKPTRYTSSVANSGTRATSWSSDRSKRKGSSSEIEHEIQLHEGRFSRPPKPDDDNQQARVVTVSFSSPLVPQTAYSDDPSSAKVGSQPQGSNDGTKEPGIRAREGSYRQRSSKPFMSPSQRKSVRGQPFIGRPISRIDEGNEDTGDDLSLVRRGNMTPSLCTPIQNRSETSLVKSSARTKGYSFHLSPLGDFTVNQADQSLHLEMSYVAQRTHPSSLRQIHGTFALATEELVKHITNTEPFEPHWEHIRRLILREKGLITLHKLNWFCPRLEDLDVSYNDIGQVSGIPSSLRTLKIQRNCLSSLTAWGHLMNLQYLDVSGNALESLDGFSSLIHLRELKANDNSIRNVDGVLGLNGLLSLKLRNNCLTTIDFEGADLALLSELDLSHNKLTSVRNVDSLPALATLSLSFNQVSNIGLSSALRSLRSLKISNNKLSTLDARMFPSLNLLYADQNSLSTILGLEHCRGLEILSAREQVAANEADCFDLDLGRSMDIRRVHLSSNRLSPKCLTPSVPLRSLQLFDVASCQIESLPGDFAVNFPNVQVLNLNFNSLAGIEEIAFMNCLARLNVAGNRIHRMRRLCQVLSKLGRTAKGIDCSLHRVDIRGNPLTVRFYPPPVTGSGRTGSQKLQASEHHNHNHPTKPGVDIPSALADLRPSENTKIPHPATWNKDDDEDDRDDLTDDKHTRHISDPFTLPPADPEADKKYLTNLDEPTRLRRRILELMLYAGSGGSVKYLDGKRLRPSFERESDMQHAWTRLEELGVLKKRDHKKEKVNGKETEMEMQEKKGGAPVAG